MPIQPQKGNQEIELSSYPATGQDNGKFYLIRNTIALPEKDQAVAPS